MSEKTLISIDPGLSSGVVIGTYSDTEPYRRTHAFQFGDGLRGLMGSIYSQYDSEEGVSWAHVPGFGYYDLDPHFEDDTVTVICEKFTPRPNPAGGGLALKSAEPLLCEGFLVSAGVMPYYSHEPKADNSLWRAPSQMYFSGGKNLSERKKLARLWRIEHGLHLTGKDVGQPDADDANSATMHAISYLRSIRHKATLEHYFKGA